MKDKQVYMRKIITYVGILCTLCIWMACEEKNNSSIAPNPSLQNIFRNYWEERMQLYPLEATAVGDYRYNDRLPNFISESYRDTLREFYIRYSDLMKAFHENLNDEDKLSKEIFEYELQDNITYLQYPTHLMPLNQFYSFTLEFPQLGSGSGNQPFVRVKDYHDFATRMKLFAQWCDQAISNMRQGIQQGYVLPEALCKKVIPQLQQIITSDPTQNIFYTPVKNMPDSFSAANKKEIENKYLYAISEYIIPSYNKLAKFMLHEYLPACRQSAGISAIPNGKAYYQFLIHHHTTSNLSPDSIYAMGLKEVARLEAAMQSVKQEVGFVGSLPDFFAYINRDNQFRPFTTPQQVLDSFWAIKKIMEPQLKKLFTTSPKTKFEIRQTEAFRAASASAEYNAGSADGSRPGIFYTPIVDAKTFNIVGMETLFLHEAIPGHHYQISLQQENKTLPDFRKFLSYSAYAEGWALYAETLGKELGLFKNPYQYVGHLSDAMHRAIRLVVDVAIHTKQMSREEAIQYMKTHERISDEEATAEIERYMAIPGQALSYKIGQFSILRMRDKYAKQLGAKFNLADFHMQILNGGNMPLEVLEKKLDRWADNL